MTKLEQLKIREAELQQILDMNDIIFNSDCTLDGVPLTKVEYEKLWEENKKYENELLQVRLTISHHFDILNHAEPEEPKQQYHVLISNDDDSGCETNLYNKKYNEPEC